MTPQEQKKFKAMVEKLEEWKSRIHSKRMILERMRDSEALTEFIKEKVLFEALQIIKAAFPDVEKG